MKYLNVKEANGKQIGTLSVELYSDIEELVVTACEAHFDEEIEIFDAVEKLQFFLDGGEQDVSIQVGTTDTWDDTIHITETWMYGPK